MNSTLTDETEKEKDNTNIKDNTDKQTSSTNAIEGDIDPEIIISPNIITAQNQQDQMSKQTDANTSGDASDKLKTGADDKVEDEPSNAQSKDTQKKQDAPEMKLGFQHNPILNPVSAYIL